MSKFQDLRELGLSKSSEVELWFRCHQSQGRLNLDFKELWIRIFCLHWHLVIALKWNLICSTTQWPGQNMNSDHRWLFRWVQTDKSSFTHSPSHLQCKSYMLVHFCACINEACFPRQLSAGLRLHIFHNMRPKTVCEVYANSGWSGIFILKHWDEPVARVCLIRVREELDLFKILWQVLI